MNFSVVMACYNCENYLDESIDSLLNQTLPFKDNIQLILVNDGSTDKTEEICQKYQNEYPNNIVYTHQENQGQGSARNLGIKYAEGKYINFLDSDDKVSNDAFEKVLNFFKIHEEIPFVSIPIIFFDAETGPHVLNYKFDNDKIVNLEKDWDHIQLHANSSFFKKELFQNYQFATNIISSEDTLMINKILIDNPTYGILTTPRYYYRKREDNTSTLNKAKHKKEFYIDRLKYFFKELINYSLTKYDKVPKFIQYLITYDIQWLFNLDYASEVLEIDEIKDVYTDIKDVLSHINNEVILSLKDDKLNIKHHLLALKYSKVNVDLNGVVTCPDIHSNYNGEIAQVFSSSTPIDQLDIHKIWIDICEIRNDTFYLSGYLMSYFKDEDIEIEIIKNNKEIFQAKRVYYKNTAKHFLGCTLEDRYNFDAEIPIDNNTTIDIKVRFTGKNSNENSIWSLPIDFSYYARLSTLSNYSISNNHFLILKGRTFKIHKYSYPKMIRSEIPILLRVLKRREDYWTDILKIRILHLLLYPYYKNKRIWLFMDNIKSADDNAEHLYKYAIGQNDDIQKYFALDKNSNDFKRLSNLPNILEFGSLKHKLMYFFAEKVISSHPDDEILNPVINKNEGSYAGMISSDKIFLQHGVTKDNVSSWLKKFEKNVKLITTVSDKEKQSFLDPGYNYDEKVIQTLGFPRFDNLEKTETKRQILIMPSWRKKLLYASDDQIQESLFFKEINSLINNKDLIEIAEKYNYEIIFKPHPRVYDYIPLFNTANITLDTNTTYQQLFKDSDLLITDYSSVAFDFAYMKKPVIYHQYANDYNFEEGYFKYKTMGFGEVTANQNELTELVEDYLKQECQMKDTYIARVDKFYKYNDKNNCRRVYDAILDL